MAFETGLFVGADPALLNSAEQWLGSPVQFLSWSTGKANWSDWLGSIGSSVSKLAGLGTDVHWTIPLFAQGGTLAAAATHAYDNDYLAAAKLLAASATGDGKIVVRVGEEFNGSWMGWAASGHEADFAQAYRNFVDAFRSVSDKFEFVWNIGVGAKGTDVAAAYPGDSYVDYIGGDLYWDSKQSWSITDPDAAFSYYKTTNYGLDWLSNFASSHGKQLSIDEWGVNSDTAAAFVQKFHDWLVSHDVAYESYWNSNSTFAGEVSNDQYPSLSALFKSLFGSTTISADTAALTGTILGTDADDILSALTGDHIIGGGGGADHITVGDGNNHIYGNMPTAVAGSSDGNDVIVAGAGSNYINGNAGDDTITVGSSGSLGVNRIQGGQGNDIITVQGAGANSVNGNLGDDTISAADATGNNLLRGGKGNDLLVAGHGHDILLGDIGDDVLRAGSGAGHITIMTGGDGTDTFDFAATGAGIRVALGGATFFQEVTDFAAGTDHLALGHPLGATSLLGQSADPFGSESLAESYASQLLAGSHDGVAALQVGGDTFLFWSADGSGALDSVVKLDGVASSSLHVTDFI